MKVMAFLFSVWVFATPPLKVTDSSKVIVSEGYSVAVMGLESEAFRVQALEFQGKTTIMVAKLVNGGIFLEKPATLKDMASLRNTVRPLLSMESTVDCKEAVRVIVTKNSKDEEIKLCHEKPAVAKRVDDFRAAARRLLAIDK